MKNCNNINFKVGERVIILYLKLGMKKLVHVETSMVKSVSKNGKTLKLENDMCFYMDGSQKGGPVFYLYDAEITKFDKHMFDFWNEEAAELGDFFGKLNIDLDNLEAIVKFYVRKKRVESFLKQSAGDV